MQSKQIFSCSLPGRRNASMASSSMARSSSPPRSSSRVESGPTSSTRISGRSQLRSSGSGGSTVIRYLRRRPPWVTIPCSSSLIFFAAAILSGMGIKKLLAFSSWLLAVRLRFHANSQKLIAKSLLLLFLPRPLQRHLAHFAAQTGFVHDRLLHDSDKAAFRPVEAEAGGQ